MGRYALVPLLLVACGDGEHDTSDHHHHHDAECHSEEGLDSYVQGLSKTGEAGAKVTFVSADPAPPDVGVNIWSLEVTDATGGSLGEGGEVVVRPFMPQHGHGSSPATFTATREAAGQTWTVPPMDLFMPGLWELTVELAHDGEPIDQVVFRFCLEG